MAGVERRLAFGVRVEDDAVGGNHDAAVRVLLAQQRQLLADVRGQERLAQVQVKQLFQPEARAPGRPCARASPGPSACVVRMRAADWRSQPMQSMLQRTVFSSSMPRYGRRGLGPAKICRSRSPSAALAGGVAPGAALARLLARQPGHGPGLGFRHALQIPAAGAGHNRQLPFGQLLAEAPGHGAEEHFRERILVQIAQMAGAVVVLATARDRQIAVDGQVVFRLAPQRPAIEPLPFEPGRPLQ